MGKLLYIIVVLLVIGWAVGFLGYNARGTIHILLIIAVIVAIFKTIRGRKIL